MLVILTKPLPTECVVAVSGGPDSMGALHFLRKRVKKVIHINHGTGEFANAAQILVQDYCYKLGIHVEVTTVTEQPPKGESKEQFWRNKRQMVYANQDLPIVTGHNLDDCVEEYLINKLVRFSDKTVMSYYGLNGVIRPFRTTPKSAFIGYCNHNRVPYLIDPSNADNSYLRNSIRNILIPSILKDVSPGLVNSVYKLIIDED